jgi:hypothetical protein
MISTGLEVLGFASAVAGAAVTWGLGAALFAAAPCLLFMGFAAEGGQLPKVKLKRKGKRAV